MLSPRKSFVAETLTSIYTMLGLIFLLLACVELGGATTAVDVYLIQYDVADASFGSRSALLNHHPSSSSSPSDLSRSVLILPLRDVNLTSFREYITTKQPLGGLLLLLPQKAKDENDGDNDNIDSLKEHVRTRDILVELEQMLIHANILYPVYFSFEDDEINSILADVWMSEDSGQPATATTGLHRFVTTLEAD